ncbi:MAG: helix-turn-helix transcriptional regulator [Paludibacteraceae bacterium]|nr:helix-turn-helix transcriptional regulator [Paludibacteraceae bacterium]
MTTFNDIRFQEELAEINPITRLSYMLADDIAERIYSVMKAKGISKKQLAELTHKQPSEVTKWLAGGHNFTCKTIAIISQALGEDIIQIAK